MTDDVLTHLVLAVTGFFCKFGAWWAMLLTMTTMPMRATRKKFSTNKCAYVVYFDATVPSTFMSTTRSLFIASLFT
jgi:hypothetical protein